jgi:putative endonuclease
MTGRNHSLRAGRASRAESNDTSWIFYILKCSDGSFYSGITNDLERRLRQHRSGRASRYTRTRRPMRIVYREPCASRSHALRREHQVKGLSRKEKEQLIARGRKPDKRTQIPKRRKGVVGIRAGGPAASGFPESFRKGLRQI